MKPGQYWIAKDVGSFKQLYAAQPDEVIRVIFKKILPKHGYDDTLDVVFINCTENTSHYIRFRNNKDFYKHFRLVKNEKRSR